MKRRAIAVQAAKGETVVLVYADRGYTGEELAAEVAAKGIQLAVVKHPEGRHGFAVLPCH
jgi:hypothetical protein